MKTTNLSKKHQLLSALALSSLVLNSACLLDGKREDAETTVNSSTGIQAGDSGAPRTLSIATFDQILNSMSSLTGTTPSTNTTNYMNLNKTSFALNGSINEITSGMWMAVTALAGNVCRDLYDQELAMPASSRLYYRNVNMGGNNPRSNIDAARDRLVLGIWGRAVDSTEDGHFDTALVDAGLNGATLNGTQTRDALLVLCTGTLGSLVAIAR